PGLATWCGEGHHTITTAGFLRSVQVSLTLPPDTALSVRRRLHLELSTRRPGQNKAFARLRAAGVVLCVLVYVASGGAYAAGELAPGSRSGLPIPRFVSLKPDRVNVRGGPTRDHDVAWVYTRAGLPVEITAESENWRRIRDWEGAEGWVYHSMLTGRRTA